MIEDTKLYSYNMVEKGAENPLKACLRKTTSIWPF